jgi:hypothetical protein
VVPLNFNTTVEVALHDTKESRVTYRLPHHRHELRLRKEETSFLKLISMLDFHHPCEY